MYLEAFPNGHQSTSKTFRMEWVAAKKFNTLAIRLKLSLLSKSARFCNETYRWSCTHSRLVVWANIMVMKCSFLLQEASADHMHGSNAKRLEQKAQKHLERGRVCVIISHNKPTGSLRDEKLTNLLNSLFECNIQHYLPKESYRENSLK